MPKVKTKSRRNHIPRKPYHTFSISTMSRIVSLLPTTMTTTTTNGTRSQENDRGLDPLLAQEGDNDDEEYEEFPLDNEGEVEDEPVIWYDNLYETLLAINCEAMFHICRRVGIANFGLDFQFRVKQLVVGDSNDGTLVMYFDVFLGPDVYEGRIQEEPYRLWQSAFDEVMELQGKPWNLLDHHVPRYISSTWFVEQQGELHFRIISTYGFLLTRKESSLLDKYFNAVQTDYVSYSR